MRNPSEDPNIRRASEEEPVPDQGPLPPRLRERLEARERRSEAKGGSAGLTVLILLLLVAAGGFIWWRSYVANGNIAARHNGLSPTSATAPDLTNRAFGVTTGAFPSEDAAIGERDRITASTHLPVSVGQTNGPDGALQFRIILGSYTTRAEAESAGHALQRESVVKDWQVVPLSQSQM